jgi:hypothetical protein
MGSRSELNVDITTRIAEIVAHLSVVALILFDVYALGVLWRMRRERLPWSNK